MDNVDILNRLYDINEELKVLWKERDSLIDQFISNNPNMPLLDILKKVGKTNKIAAMKLCRDRQGGTLRDAKETVEFLFS